MSIYHTNLSEIPCPYCYAFVDLSDEPAYYTDEEDNPAECDSCGKEFYITGHATWKWSTQETES